MRRFLLDTGPAQDFKILMSSVWSAPVVREATMGGSIAGRCTCGVIWSGSRWSKSLSQVSNVAPVTFATAAIQKSSYP